jgi:hypothetical protein
VWSLHVGLFLVYAPFVLLSRKTFGNRPTLEQITDGFPAWVIVLVVTVLAYGFLDSFRGFYLTGGGNGEIANGQYLLTSHGRFLAHLTEKEYHFHKAAELRGFSGGWFIFYLMPAVYLLKPSSN